MVVASKSFGDLCDGDRGLWKCSRSSGKVELSGGDSLLFRDLHEEEDEEGTGGGFFGGILSEKSSGGSPVVRSGQIWSPKGIVPSGIPQE